jgi:ABC-2 type transport system permease protein
MTAFLAITQVTIKQTLRLRRFVGLGLLSLSAAATFVLASLSPGQTSSNAFDLFLGISIGTFMNILVPVVTLITATSVMGDERRDNTMSFLVLRPVSRVTIGTAKVVAAFVEAFALSGIGAIGLGIVSAVEMNDWAYLVPLLVGTAIATAAYAAVFVPLGYVAKRATLIGLTYLFIWENGIAGAVSAVAGISPWRIGVSGMAGLAPSRFVLELPDFAIGSIAPGAGGAIAKAIVLMALSVAVLTAILLRRDLAS